MKRGIQVENSINFCKIVISLVLILEVNNALSALAPYSFEGSCTQYDNQ